tara:strand:+ start:203 stop:649 length:447 start_codon:yes stop_codon:yes gene_type:complete
MVVLEKQLLELIEEGKVLYHECKESRVKGSCVKLQDLDREGKFGRWKRRCLSFLNSKFMGIETYSSIFECKTKAYRKSLVNDAVNILEEVLNGYKDGFLQESMTLEDFVKNVSKSGDEKSKGKLKSLLQEEVIKGIVGSGITGISGLF